MSAVTHSVASARRAGRGFTLVELLVVMSVVAVMVAATVPSMAAFIRNSALNNAQQDLTQFIRKAKSIARNQNITITLKILAATKKATLSSADGRINETLRFPDLIAPTADSTYVFNSFGLVDKTGTITLQAVSDSTRTKGIVIENLFAQITTT